MKLNTEFLFKPVWLVYGIVIGLLYFVFHDSYMNEYLDNAWSFSWAYGWWTNGQVYDQVFGYLDGDGGTALFSRSYVFIYGAIASLLGWSRGVGIGISSAFTIGTAVLWYFIIRELNYRKELAVSFALIILVLEIFYGNGHKIRVDSMALFLDSLAFLLFIRNRYFWAGLILAVAFETHPFAIAAGFWMLAWLWSERRQVFGDWRTYIFHGLCFFAGLALGFLYWWLLHGRYVGDANLNGRLGGNVLLSYYFGMRYSWRHIPELVLVVASLAVFLIRRSWKTHPFVLPFIIASLVSTLVMARGNYHYAAYVYPSFVLILLLVSDDLNAAPLLLAGVLLFQLPQYAWLFYDQRGYIHSEYISTLRHHVPADSNSIYGHPGAWFAFQERDFRAYGFYGRSGMEPGQWPESFVVIENREFLRWNGEADLKRFENFYEIELISQWNAFDGKPVKIWSYRRYDG